MSIWGSLIGGMVGFSLGGPFGMLLGSLIGGKISRARAGRTGNFGAFAQPQQIFALSLIVLSAKLSKADGQVSKEELVAVKDKLKIPENEIEQVGKIFNKAKEESTGYEPYAQQIAQIYKNNPNVLEEVINILFYIAEADGNVSQSELNMMQHIAQIFGLNESQFNSIKESRKSSDKLNPYVVLGSKPEEDLSSIRKKYIQLSKENHPDLLVSKGVPTEVIDESKKKNSIFRDSENFIVDNGKTDHKGIELSLDWLISLNNIISTNITYGDHKYDFETDTSMREKIRVGNEIDTAPKMMANLILNSTLNEDTSLAFEIEHMSSYYTDAANLHEYEGHTLYHARFTRKMSDTFKTYIRVDNIFDKAYAERADFNAFGGDRYFPGLPREFYIGLEYTF